MDNSITTEGLSNSQSTIQNPSSEQQQPLSYPASNAQKRLWLLDKLQSGNTSYHMFEAAEIEGSLNVQALEKSITQLSKRHDSLRTTFAEDTPTQKVHHHNQPILHITDWREDTPYNEETSQAHINDVVQQPFDLTKGPLIRWHLVRIRQQFSLLIICLHHIIFDRWSLSLLHNELEQLYSHHLQSSEGEPATLPKLSIQYSDYTLWREKTLQAPLADKALNYWKEKLTGSAPLTLPYDIPETSTVDHHGERRYRNIDAETIKGLESLASQQGATLFMGLLAVFNLLLYRWTGLSDINIGTPFADRRLKGTEHLLGFFVNTLVLRHQPDGKDSFLALLKQIRQTCFNGYRYASTPFNDIVEALQPNRQVNRNPLFNIEFALQKIHKSPLTLEDTVITPLVPAKGSAQYDLTLTLCEKSDGSYDARIEYRTGLFHSSTIDWLLERIDLLLKDVLKNPGQPLESFELLAPEEREQLIKGWNQTAMDYPRDCCLHQLIQQQSLQTPDAIAVIHQQQSITYQQLEHRANQLAHHLISLGVKPDSFVGICIERSIDMVVGLLAILKAGAAYLPLDKEYPADRLQHMLEDSAVKVLLSQSWIAGKLPQNHAQCVAIDQLPETVNHLPVTPPSSSVEPHHIAYMIYTSGSTGKPKGVQVEHRNVINFLISMQKEPGLKASDRLLAVTTLSFDIAVLELYLPLITGASVVIASHVDVIDGHKLKSLIESANINFLQATPVTWRLLINAGWQGAKDFKILCGGEAMPLDLAAELYARAGDVWNMYGPTETTVWSSCYRLASAKGPVLIGRPIGNTQIYLLDERLNPVPTGVPGELYIGGDGVTRGYLNRPELNAERFIPDPFSDAPNARLYRTGDGARFKPCGNIEYQERLDNQVKVRGNRIELGEIEFAIAETESIAQSVVIVREDEPGDPRITAYCIASDGNEVDASLLRQQLRNRLPSYMIPQFFIGLTQFPQTPNGKIDRKALPAPDKSTHNLKQQPPKTPQEKHLAAIWQEVLECDTIGRYDNFFELGGHSILALKAIDLAKQQLGISITPMAMIMDTLEQIVADENPEEEQAIPSNADANTNVEASNQAFYFGENDSLFGIYHPTVGTKISPPVLLCYPLLMEATQVHWAFKQLANQLAKQGHPVLRFDYRGTGDSSGEFEEASVEQWQADIIQAAKQLANQSGQRELIIVGQRFGATLALAAHQQLVENSIPEITIDTVIAWDPILDGANYLAQCETQHRNNIDDYNQRRKHPAHTGQNELLGYHCPPALRASISGTTMPTKLAGQEKIHFLTSQESAALNDYYQGQPTAIKERLTLDIVADPSGPIEQHYGFKLFLPNQMLRRIVDLIRGQNP